MKTKNKVLAYIFRFNENRKEVLVFDHRDDPEVNPQIPAGTVDTGESLAEALFREIYEESGLKFDKFDEYIGTFDYIRHDLNELHKRHVFSFVSNHLSANWEHIVSAGEEDKGLIFDYYWMDIKEAKNKLVASMGEYL